MVIRGARRTERDCRAMSRQNSHIARAQAHLNEFITDLIREAVASGDVRNGIPPGELAAYCLQALAAASGLGSKAACDRLVRVKVAGLEPARSGSREMHNVAPNGNQGNGHLRLPAGAKG
jgi:hypothetical protein